MGAGIKKITWKWQKKFRSNLNAKMKQVLDQKTGKNKPGSNGEARGRATTHSPGFRSNAATQREFQCPSATRETVTGWGSWSRPIKPVESEVLYFFIGSARKTFCDAPRNGHPEILVPILIF